MKKKMLLPAAADAFRMMLLEMMMFMLMMVMKTSIKMTMTQNYDGTSHNDKVAASS